MTNVWLYKAAYTRILEEALRKMPNETGGILMGYWGNADEAVVTAIVGPGPKAIHKPVSFVPDHHYHTEEISWRYQQSGFTETYLGDWHTHPHAKAYMSERDKKTLKRIADFKEARLEKPLMMILGTQPFSLNAWVHTYTKRRCYNRSAIEACNLDFC